MNIKRDIDRTILEDARAGKDQTVYLAVAILRVDDKPDRLVFSSPEYGDYAGIEMMWDFIENCERLLQPGESLHLELRSIDWQEMHLQALDKVGKCLPR